MKNLLIENDLSTGMLVLSRENPPAAIQKIVVYKKLNEDPYCIATTIAGTETSFKDKAVPLGSRVKYRIKIGYTNGMVSGFSEEVGVEN